MTSVVRDKTTQMALRVTTGVALRDAGLSEQRAAALIKAGAWQIHDLGLGEVIEFWKWLNTQEGVLNDKKWAAEVANSWSVGAQHKAVLTRIGKGAKNVHSFELILTRLVLMFDEDNDD